MATVASGEATRCRADLVKTVRLTPRRDLKTVRLTPRRDIASAVVRQEFWNTNSEITAMVSLRLRLSVVVW